MSDASPIQPIVSQPLGTNSTGDSQPTARILDIPERIKNTDQSKPIRAKVVRVEEDGTLQVRTDKGDITLKPDRPVNIKRGDEIEIQIQKGDQPLVAKIRVTVKNTTETTTPTPPPQTPDITLPPPLSIQKLINTPKVEVENLRPQQVQKIVQPFIENVNYSLQTLEPVILNSITLESGVVPIPPLETSEILVTTLPAPEPTQRINSIAPSETTLLPPSERNPEVINTILKQPVTQIPLSIVAAQKISNPKPEPITFNLSELPETHISSIVTDVKVNSISLPNLQIVESETQILQQLPFTVPEERAGETRAVIEGFTADKHFPVFRITTQDHHENHRYALKIPIDDLPIGTQIELTVLKAIATEHTTQSQASLSNPQISAPLVPFSALTPAYFLTPEIWPVLQEINNTLFQLNPQIAQIYNAVIPNAANPAQMGPAVLFFIAAMRSGDIQNWLGDKAIDTLRRAGKGELLNRLSGELSSLSRMGKDPVSQEWRSMSLPMAWQNDIHKVVLHYRREEQDETGENDKKGSKIRFVMDLSLSNMGKVQLDGLFIANTSGTGRLDLVLRTEQSFSQAMKQKMRGTYKNALDETKFTGELSFQDKKDQWVLITPDNPSQFSENI